MNMQTQKRAAHDRGHANHGWLDTFHTFSFADYHDPQHMGYRSLRVINEDRIAGGRGFGAHPHQDMEIITYVVSGALQHKDSMGNTAIIRPGDVQKMSAGTGVMHAEFNPLPDTETHLLQIWIMPNKKGIAPAYAQHTFTEALGQKNLVLAAAPVGSDAPIPLQQDAYVYLSHLKKGEGVTVPTKPNRGVWVQMVRGVARIGDAEVQAGDGLSVTGATNVVIEAQHDAELIVFDMA
jgi:redox-sensitive bicupin YhaK (pirin superfamily)